MIPDCEGCLWEFEEALRAEEEHGLHYATSIDKEFDGRKHFFLLMVDEYGNVVWK